ncbi:SET and MYND domain-containing protein DDB_G0273589-like [Bradysia coprophila]|uniref:SET and MYND domain-containing protein DDB_G0273589-like n=1 Tax=Bradysia coprophila TaxID=38358 RepID=UPI00187D861F|nr:SET and MYND domain-containing protein DDB_G0273589-like [Bradysia coprophila]
MLWQKESDADGAAYIDLLQNTKLPLGKFRLNRIKNNVQSIHARTEGNRKYGQNDFTGAMELYNESICFAEKGSEQLSLAYANRSTCFLRLQLYDRCLVDIQLAKASNNQISEQLMSKLNAREKECLKSKSSDVTVAEEPALSFDPHEKWPCMVNVLDIERSDQYGRLVRANSDIQIGDTILIEEAFVKILLGTERNRCSNCIKEKMNFIPCDNCADTMYCNETCANNNFHEDECDMTMGAEDCYDGESLTFILRSVIIAINTFRTIAELMEFVENCRASDPLDITEPVDTPISEYRTFFKLAVMMTNERVSNLLKTAYLIFHSIMGSRLSKRFETKDSQRFLVHLTIHHAIILRVNAFGGCTEPGNGLFGHNVDDDDKQRQQDIHLFTSYFNHSCIPNVILLVKDSIAICKALRPIKQGEQLFITYIDDEGYGMTEKQRNDQLEMVYGFRCQCEFCRKGDKHKNIEQLQLDADFRYVAINIPQLIQHSSTDLMKGIKGHCIAFLKKYPLQSIASTEGGYILTTLSSLMQKEIESC